MIVGLNQDCLSIGDCRFGKYSSLVLFDSQEDTDDVEAMGLSLGELPMRQQL